ncbi:hypothetical protein MNV_330021 [Candidatus Methanoperedens nitroreducens]|uniref:Uncharacterized protein n=1 Tax=Candidatus Methanoperedens nitratireducens TaxID=1392998 RepID=A0A284VQ79_9EURY|nr:hypothetical protein MNV_330021 [Candidatus Methanoperedens nitroreducens]
MLHTPTVQDFRKLTITAWNLRKFELKVEQRLNLNTTKGDQEMPE